MNREIKFRGIRVDNGEWAYGNLVMVRDGDTSRRYPCIVISYNHDTFDWFEVKPETVGEFTGLLDKNGKEIYEGDIIVRTTIPDRIVEWDSDDAGWFTRKISTGNLYRINIDDFDLVIGNIHQNPELL